MSIISASTTLTTALQYTADTNGTLVFKTGATPTTALTLNSDQSATFAGTVNFATAAFTNLSYTGTLTGGTGIVNLGSGQFYKDASGNVGIGTSSPTQKLDIAGSLALTGTGNRITGLFDGTPQANRVAFQTSTTNSQTTPIIIPNGTVGSGATASGIIFHDSTSVATGNGATGSITNIQSTEIRLSSGIQGTGTYLPLTMHTGGSERLRIDTSGNLLVRCTTSGFGNDNGTSIETGSVVTRHVGGTAGGSAYYWFTLNGGAIGSITQNGTTGVLYNVTSDYRLKDNAVPLTGASEFIMALQPKSWDWYDGSGKGVGFIAHEFMEVAKHSGNGEKDAIDAEGKPVYQSIQPSSSEVMANLVALVQELKAELDTVKTELAELKGTN